MKYTVTVQKIGRKWMEVKVDGKKSVYKAQLLIDERTDGFKVDETHEIACRFESKSSSYGKKCYLYSVTEEEEKEIIADFIIAKADKWMGYIRNAFMNGRGHVYQRGIDEIKSLGENVYKKYEVEINNIIATVSERKEAEYKARKAAREAEYAAKEAAREAEESKYTYIVLPGDEGFDSRPSRGELIEKNGKVYEVVSSYYNKYDGWSFGVMCEEWHRVKCIDITDTEKGAEILARKAAREAEEKAKREVARAEKARIDALIEAIKKNGELISRTEEGEMHIMPDGEIMHDTFDIYGNGRKIIKTDAEIWLLINNGMDGDDWSCNTVRTGGAGSYGWKAPVGAIDEGMYNK